MRAMPATPDEIWLTEHPPVYTLGLAGRREHLLRDNGIPAIKVDRGGQITYHGPGQLVAYTALRPEACEAGHSRHGPAHRGGGGTNGLIPLGFPLTASRFRPGRLCRDCGWRGEDRGIGT